MSKRFIASYAGEAEYEIDGQRYEVRHFANPEMAYNTGVYEREILPAVGTVRHKHSPEFSEFPPAAVVAEFPGFVGARWNTQTWTLEYDGPAPRLMPDPLVSCYVTFERPGVSDGR